MFPVLFKNTAFATPTYVLIISIAYCIGILWSLKRAQKFNLSKNTTLDLCLCIMIGGFIGSRAFHIIFEYPDYYIKNPVNIFKIWQGGFVYFGGMIGAAVFSAMYFTLKKTDPKKWLDVFTPALAFGYAFGRIGCLMAGCCFGKECHLPWAITFPHGAEAPAGIPLHPTQLYALFWELGLLALLLLLEKAEKFKVSQMFFGWLMGHSVGRILMESFRNDWRGPDFFGLSLSTWISFIIFFIGLLGFASRKKNIP